MRRPVPSAAGALPRNTVSDHVVVAAARQAERGLAYVRLAFCLTVQVRWVLVTDLTPPRLGIGLSSFALAVGFSLIALRISPSRIGSRFFALSAGLDTVLCFLALLPMALWPQYPGALVNKPDLAGLLLVVSASALRLAPAVCAATLAANLAAFLVLTRLDRAGSWSSELRDVLWIGVIQLAAAGALAILLADRTRRLVRKGAEASAQAERVKQNLAVVLREHHDLRTELAAATLNADLAEREVLDPERPSSGAGTRAAVLLGELRAAIRTVNGSVASIKERSREELFELLHVRPADIGQSMQKVGSELEARFPSCRLEVRPPRDAQAVSIAGGDSGLCSVLRNLLVNACEGHAGVAATEIEMSTSSNQSRVVITVSDDGPGFSDPLIETQDPCGSSSKPDGSGVGLSLVRQIVHASGGEFELRNRSRGGGVARVVLPLATWRP